MKKTKTRADHVKDAADAMSDLNMFTAIMALCESSLFSSDSYPGEARIVTTCKVETAKCLTRYDRAMAAATR